MGPRYVYQYMAVITGSGKGFSEHSDGITALGNYLSQCWFDYEWDLEGELEYDFHEDKLKIVFEKLQALQDRTDADIQPNFFW